MLESNDQRNYHRMKIDCPAKFEAIGGNQPLTGAVVKNLSSGGMLILVEDNIDAGSQLRITIEPVSSITPPLTADIEVLRCTAIPDGEGAFSAACKIITIL